MSVIAFAVLVMVVVVVVVVVPEDGIRAGIYVPWTIMMTSGYDFSEA